MAILVFSLAMTLAAFGWLVFMLLFPTSWKRFMEWENRLSLRLGVAPGAARWMKRHETGRTLKVIVLLLGLVSAMCALETLHRLR